MEKYINNLSTFSNFVKMLYSSNINKKIISDVCSRNKLVKKNINNVISPILTRSAFTIPDCPEYISRDRINKITNIYILKKIENDYDAFLDKKCQILMLLNVIDEVFEIRDQLLLRINALKRQHAQIEIYREKIL